MAAEGEAIERAERPPAQRAAADFEPSSAGAGPLPAHQPVRAACQTMSGSRSASARASILSGRPSIIPTSASSAASPSSTAWRACSARSRPWASTPSASTMATPATCSPGYRRIRYRASSSCFPTLGRRRRHQKRRLVSPDAVADFARVLKQGGELRFASDSGDYAGEALLTILSSRAFAWTAERPKDWRVRPCDWPETRYERKALSEGRKPAYLSFRRL